MKEQLTVSGGAKVGPDRARALAVKPVSRPAVPRQVSWYGTVWYSRV